MKATKLMVVAATMLASSSALASGNFQLAVIEGSQGARPILKGDYQHGLSQIGQDVTGRSGDDLFEDSMSLCVANIKLNQLDKAYGYCQQAVKHVDDAKAYRPTKAKFKALALNNLAIVKYLKQDNQGAYQDFNSAIELSDNVMVGNNRQKFSHLMTAAYLAR